jgi:hypothetical protein
MDMTKRGINVARNEGILVFTNTKKGLNYIKQKLKFLFLPYAVLKIKILNTKDYNLNILLNFSFNSLARFIIKPAQVRDEIVELLKILNGFASGNVWWRLSRLESSSLQIVCIIKSKKSSH